MLLCLWRLDEVSDVVKLYWIQVCVVVKVRGNDTPLIVPVQAGIAAALKSGPSGCVIPRHQAKLWQPTRHKSQHKEHDRISDDTIHRKCVRRLQIRAPVDFDIGAQERLSNG